MLDVVGRAPSRFPSLHVDDGAERALVRAAAAGVEGRVIARRALDVLAQQERHRRRLDRREVVEIIVDRLEGTACGVAQQGVEPLLRLACEQADPQVESLLNVGLHLGEHRQAAGNVKPADDHGYACGPQRAGDVHGSGKLVRLHADETDQAEATVPLKVGR